VVERDAGGGGERGKDGLAFTDGSRRRVAYQPPGPRQPVAAGGQGSRWHLTEAGNSQVVTQITESESNSTLLL
jgi:hypothetical protein